MAAARPPSQKGSPLLPLYADPDLSQSPQLGFKAPALTLPTLGPCDENTRGHSFKM